MANEEITEVTLTRKVSVKFQRTVSDGNYGSNSAEVWISGEVPFEASTGDIALAVGDLFTAAKAAVLDELGIEYEPDADLILREKITVKPEQVRSAPPQANVNASSSDGIRIMNPAEASPDPIPAKVVNAAKADGVTALFDNRLTKTGKQPDFKESVARGSTGHGKDGSAKGYWIN